MSKIKILFISFLGFLMLGSALPAAAHADIDLFPMEEGREWTFDVTKFGPYYACNPGRATERVTGTTRIDGQVAAVFEFCGQGALMSKDRGQVLSYDSSDRRWFVWLDTPVDGLRWSEFRVQSEWRELGDYAVSGQVYPNCFEKRRLVPYEHFLVYCEGVGLVHERMIDERGFGWDRKLLDTSVPVHD